MSSTKAVQSTTTVAIPATTEVTVPADFPDEKWPLQHRVDFPKDEWPVIHRASGSGAGEYEGYTCTLTVRRHANGSTLVGYSLGEINNFEEFYVMATPETTSNAIGEVCDNLFPIIGGLWRNLIVNFEARCEAIPAMAVTNDPCSGQAVAVNPNDWPAVIEASQQAPSEGEETFDTAKISVPRHAEERALLRAAITLPLCDGEADHGIFFPPYAKGSGHTSLSAYISTAFLQDFIEFLYEDMDWRDLIDDVTDKIEAINTRTVAAQCGNLRSN